MSDASEVSDVFVDLGSAQKRDPQWLIKNLVPPGLVFIGAPPKSSKSTMSIAIALLVAGYKCKALPPTLSEVELGGTVMMFSYEADAGELRWIAEEGLGVKVKDNGGILVCEEPSEFQLDNERGMSRLLHWLNVCDPRLVILDPLRNFHSADENDSGAMSRLLSPIRHWALSHEACVMVVHHAKKLNEDKQHYDSSDLRGSSAMFGMANGVLIFTPRGEGQMYIKATFKRGAGWEKTVSFAAYGNAGLYDVELDDVAKGFLDKMPKGVPVNFSAYPEWDQPYLIQMFKHLLQLGYVERTTQGYRKL